MEKMMGEVCRMCMGKISSPEQYNCSFTFIRHSREVGEAEGHTNSPLFVYFED
jgi:hypothetical protein